MEDMPPFRLNSYGNSDNDGNGLKLLRCRNDSGSVPQYRLINFIHSHVPFRLLRIPPEPKPPSLLVFRAQTVNKFPSIENWQRTYDEKQKFSCPYRLRNSRVCKAVQTNSSANVGIQTDEDDFKFMNSALVYAHTNFLIAERMRIAQSLMNASDADKEIKVDASIQTAMNENTANLSDFSSIDVISNACNSSIRKFAKFKHDIAKTRRHLHDKSSISSQPVISVEKSNNILDDCHMNNLNRAVSSNLHNIENQPYDIDHTHLSNLNQIVPSNFHIAGNHLGLSLPMISNGICSTSVLFEEVKKIDMEVANVQELSDRLKSVAGSCVSHYSLDKQAEDSADFSLTVERPIFTGLFQKSPYVNVNNTSINGDSDNGKFPNTLNENRFLHSKSMHDRSSVLSEIYSINANSKLTNSNAGNSLNSSISFQRDSSSNDSHSLTTITFISNELKVNSASNDSDNIIPDFSNLSPENGSSRFIDDEIDWDRVDELIKD